MGSCAGPGAPEETHGLSFTGIPASYMPAFEGLKAALEAGEDDTARGIAAQIRRRLSLDGATRAQVEDLLVGFERVLQGRKLISGMELWLELVPQADSHMAAIRFHGRSGHSAAVTLRPGAASLEHQRRTLLPDGRSHVFYKTHPLEEMLPVELDQESGVGLQLHEYDRRIPTGALAVNDRWVLRLRSGSVTANGVRFPAMKLAVQSAQRVELAPVIPNGSVDPAVLVKAAEVFDTPLPALLERTARILPKDREAALDGLTPLVETWTPEQIVRLVPSLRWLAGNPDLGGDPLVWRDWLRARSARRTQTGTLDISDS